MTTHQKKTGTTADTAATLLSSLLLSHKRLKAVRHRGQEVPFHAGVVKYLGDLEKEMQRIRTELDSAWLLLDSRDFRKCSRHMDHAQQRIHKVLKRMAKSSRGHKG